MSWLDVLQIVNAAVVIAAPLLLLFGRKYFADRGVPEALEKGIREDLATLQVNLRQELHNGLSTASAYSIQQHGALSTQLVDVKHAMDSAMTQVLTANERAATALHRAEMAEQKIAALDRLLTTRLDNIDSHMRGIEELLRAASVTARGNRSAG